MINKLRIQISFNFNTPEENIWHYRQIENGFSCTSIRLNSNGDYVGFDYEDITNMEMLEILHNTTIDDMVVELTEEVLMNYL